MEYSLLVSTVYFVCGCFYMIFGAHVIATNVKNNTSRLFLLVTSSLAVWSFTISISNSAPTAESSAFWRCLSVFGWGFFHVLLLHFTLILTKHKFQLNKLSKIIIFYLPTFINIILFAPFGFLAEKQYEMVPSIFGWRNLLPANIGQAWINIFYITYTAVAVILLIRWWKKIEPHNPLKRYINYFLISIMLPLIVGSLTDILPGVLGLTQLPKFAIVLMLFPAIFLFITLQKFGFLIERPRLEFMPSDSGIFPEEGRLRLFETAAAIFTIGAAGSFYAGYFIAEGNLATELSLALAVLICGICLRFIPWAVKKYAIQDALFLIISIVGMTFFIITEIDRGAVTVWAVYTIFLLYTVVLNRRILAFLFLAATLIIQGVVGIISPEVSVTIDNAEYLARMIIIILTFVAVRYLAREYISKLQGYQRFTKEQEVLEKISTKFISVNNENAREKIDEMFKLSAETLDFDQGYLVDFSADYEDATIVNAHTRDGSVESLPFSSGMKVKTAALPMAKSLIAAKQPVGCVDIESIPFDEGGEERNFFASRGINSYYALPIILENKLIGMLVVEDRKKAKLQVRGKQVYFLGIIANILGDTRKKILYEEKLYHSAYFDEVTELGNRNMLRRIIEQTLHDRKESEKLWLFDIELDNLRMINDTFGHNIGEQIVKESASILKTLMKEGCSLSRIDTGKFIIVMPVAETAEQVYECANKIVDAFSDPILPKEGIDALFVTPTVGVAVYPNDGRDVDTLLKNADLAGYEAKSSDNKIVFCSEQLKNRIKENTLLTNRLFKSMQNEEFYLEFQPQISCSTGKTVGVEALLRWNYDDKKRIPPDTFIPMLEQTGLIHDVGLWVLEQALQEHNRLIAKGFPPLRFSINLSVVQLKKETFVSNVSKLIEESRVDPKYIELEITESMLSKNFSDAIKKLSKLKEIGINIAIDDFGKGYSSLHRLEMVPFNRIKIDKSIIDDITLERKKTVIAKVIVSLAKALMADITAEGVETKEQLDFMRALYCDEIQGYYFSRPLSAEALEEFLKKE
ncbi:MAG: EAL domain-containing protein [Dehalococcoidales bacterium]|nr:EAL domain-containing protein [Dehalococcoidales bacterium]